VTTDGRAPHVSIVMPVFNAGPWLGRALDSVAAQTYRDFELVIVDDGSTEPRTRARLDAAAARPGVTLHRTENRGPSRARNLAIERARADVILPLDADDWLHPRFLEKTVPVLDAEPDLGVVYTWVGLVGEHHGVWRTGGFSVKELLTRCTIHVASLYRRRLWEEAGGYDPAFVESCEDWDLWLGAAARGWRGRCVPEVLVYYRRSATSRERHSRTPGISARLMRTLVAKHRPLYEANLEDAIAGMYEERSKVSLMVERIYDHPVMRVLGRLRGLLWARPRDDAGAGP
jgi:glycosyltransferase involved in cell wall biosynthesis